MHAERRAPSCRGRVLVADDETSLLDLVTMALDDEGYETAVARTGAEALESFSALPPDLLILDRMLPDLDGVAVCRRVRSSSDLPILMLTARAATTDKVEGLDSGADDYLTKPFRLPELMARVRALRRGLGPGDTLTWLDIVLEPSSHTAARGGVRLSLTPREFQLLELLMRRPRQVFTREQILSHLWGWDFAGDTNVVDVHVSALRNKLGDGDRQVIRTVRGVGYGLGP